MADSNSSSVQNRQHQAYITVKQAIIENRLAPGTRITIDAVASRFGVSRTPVTLALAMLRKEGLIDRSAGGEKSTRYYVVPLCREEAEEVIQLLRATETTALSLLIEQTLRSDNVVEELSGQLLEFCTQSRSSSERSNYFHRLLARDCGEAVDRSHLQLFQHYVRYQRGYGMQFGGKEDCEAHKEILESLADGNLSAARAKLESHWADLEARLCKLIQERGDIGTFLSA